MSDILLKTFFEKYRWEHAIEKGLDKNMDKSLLRSLTDPFVRVRICEKLENRKYQIAPPHEARIPKDDGTFRTVYVNDGLDRIILSIINDMFFDLCPELIHKSCVSYQRGIGCGKVIQSVSKVISQMQNDDIGIKIDLSKYFDSVPIKYIDNIFDYIESKYGQSVIIDLIRAYYHNDTVLDIHKTPIQKYSSLRQGCAVAAFLADAVLCDIDRTLSDYEDIYYVRYSDDILIVGQNWQTAYDHLQKLLSEKELILNPKKVEFLHKNKWFKFLGFTLKDDSISLSKSRIKSFQKEINERTIRSHDNFDKTVHNVQRYLYTGQNNYSWATSVLPVINVPHDIQTLNSYVMDAIRASITGKTQIGGLGFNINGSNGTITRGKGKNVKSNLSKIPKISDYMSIQCMQNVLKTSRQAFDVVTANI